jgi:hypothetical protein
MRCGNQNKMDTTKTHTVTIYVTGRVMVPPTNLFSFIFLFLTYFLFVSISIYFPSEICKIWDRYKSTMNWCSVYLTPQALPKYIYLSPPLIFPTTYNGIRTKNRPVWITPALLPYVEWDRFVTLAGSKSRLRVTLSYLVSGEFFI